MNNNVFYDIANEVKQSRGKNRSTHTRLPRSLRSLAMTCSAFSLVEAMIILVLISVAIMMLIPLMTPQKVSIPKWQDGITYGEHANDRVGIADADPYSQTTDEAGVVDNKYAKLATPNLSVHNNSGKDINSIFLGDSFRSDSYCSKTDSNCSNSGGAIADSKLFVPTATSIQLGMNTCATNITSKIMINTNADNDTDNCNDNININNKIVQRNNAIGISNSSYINNTDDTQFVERSLIYIKHDITNNRDNFRINLPVSKSANGTPTNEYEFVPALEYNGTTLSILSGSAAATMQVLQTDGAAGIVYLNGYVGNPTSNDGKNVQCDTDSDGNCTRSGSNFYRDSADPDSYWTTYNAGAPIKMWSQVLNKNDLYIPTQTVNGNGSGNGDGDVTGDGDGQQTTPSDIRLKNILSEYTKGIREILKIDTYVYSYKKDKENKTYVGIIAQKLKGIFDEALHKDDKGYYSYERTPLLYAMTNSVKDINTRQKNIENKQKEASKEADRLIKMYK